MGASARSRISLGSGLQSTDNGAILAVHAVQGIFRVLITYGLVSAPVIRCAAVGEVGRRWAESDSDALLYGRG